MACAFLSHTKEYPEAVPAALDLSCKPAGCNNGSGCITCIFNRLGPGGDNNQLLKQWPAQGHFLSASPPIYFDYNSNQFKPEDQQSRIERTRKSSERSGGSPNKIRRTSPKPVSVSAQLSPHAFVHHHNADARKSPTSPPSSSRSSPANGCFRSPSFHGVTPDAFGYEPFDRTSPFGSQHLPLGMLSPQQLSLNACFSLHPFKTSPTTTKSSPDRHEDTRSGSSSPTTRSLSSPDLPNTAPEFRTAATARTVKTAKNTRNTKYDKDLNDSQKRLQNNLAAQRCRHVRRTREDHIATACWQMMNIHQRLLLIRSEYHKLLS